MLLLDIRVIEAEVISSSILMFTTTAKSPMHSEFEKKTTSVQTALKLPM
jgi:hypothetical protein